MRLGFIEPHLKRYGGIRRVVELSNALIARGHEVTIYVPAWEKAACSWMRCDATVTHLGERHPEALDLLVVNHEPQWFLFDRFTGTAARAVYFLHAGWTYDKEGSWEMARVPVDLRLANSGWTADMAAAEHGERPVVLSGGVNPEHFRAVDVPKRYPVLCVGDDREWKGTDDIEAAAGLLGLPLERYAGKDLPQSAMAAEYAAAEVFVVGSTVEGFGQPGIEALACGTPLVTTDNGGCRDYAVHEETALVVEPGDVEAMAASIRRLREDPALAARMRANGLELVREQFSWPAAAERFEQLIEATLEARSAEEPAASRLPLYVHRPPTWDEPIATDALVTTGVLRTAETDPELTVVVLAWQQLTLTQRCVQSVRQHTDVPYELVLVDNGSDPDAAQYAQRAGDLGVAHASNRGFAAGMNAGLAVARGRAVCFLNNDTVLPERWASRLLETLDAHPDTGAVVPALTEAGNVRTVRDEPGEAVERLAAFEPPPSAVLVTMPTALARAIGGWDESYAVASGEDLELAFVLWVNDRQIHYDSRVLVDHVGHATSDLLPDRERLWADNRRQFLDRWVDPSTPVTRLDGVDDEVFRRLRDASASVAIWMDRYFRARDRERALGTRADALGSLGLDGVASSAVARRAVRGVWGSLRDVVPESARQRLWPYVRQHYYRFFPERHPAVMRGERAASRSR